MSLAQKGLILVLVPLSAGTIFTALVYLGVEQAEREVKEESRLREAAQVSEYIVKNLFDAALALGAYGTTGGTAMRKRYVMLRAETPGLYKTCRELLRNQPQTMPSLDKIEMIENRALKIMDMTKSAIDEGNTDFVHLKHLREQFQSLLEQAMEEAQQLGDNVRDSRRKRSHVLHADKNSLRAFLACGVIGNCVLSYLLASFFTKGIGNRLFLVTDNATRLARRSTLNPPLDGTDEIAELDKSFHFMADRLTDMARKERAAVENAAEVICSIDEQGNFRSMNPASLRVWGYQPEDLISRPIRGILPGQDVNPTLTFLANAFDKEGELLFENRVRRESGELIDVYWSIYRSLSEEVLFCIAHDVTLRKQAESLLRESEERINLTMASVPIGLFVVNAYGIIEYANETGEAMVGAGNLQGTTAENLFCADLGDWKSDPQIGIGSLETTVCRSTGEMFPAEVTLSSFLVRGERKILVACKDVTERHAIEQTKREFVAMVSHDLRTPLTSLQGTIYLLVNGALGTINERGAEILRKMDGELLRLMRLINDLLDLEKLKSGKFDLQLQEAKISELVEAAVNAVRQSAELRQIEVVVESVDWMIECDGARIIQVLVNLLSNALKFSPSNSRIEVSIIRFDSFIEVAIRDRGRGVPAEFATAIFEKFKQVKREDSIHHNGTGLGLPICKAIIEQHGGTIGVSSIEGQGSTFWFRLPDAKTT